MPQVQAIYRRENEIYCIMNLYSEIIQLKGRLNKSLKSNHCNKNRSSNGFNKTNMNLKNKIVAAVLCALIAGIGIFGTAGNNALAQTGGNTDQTIAQMMQMIETLQQQIQQIIQLIAQLKPQETCGNGICRFGETATSCPTDCGAPENCTAEGEIKKMRGPACCQGLTMVQNCGDGNILGCPNDGSSRCTRCGNGVCGTGENSHNCTRDCGNPASDNGKAKCSATGGVWKYSDCASDCIYNTEAERLAGGKTCAKICLRDFICECASGKYWSSREEGCTLINETCGNGTCRFGETAASCPADCNDCMIGFKTNECCACPQKISRSLIGTDGWVAYEKGKDYRALPKKENCAGILCSVCADINAIYQSNCASCGDGVCDDGETATNCPADCPATENKTCSELCKFKGYAASRCNMWSTGTLYTASSVGCKAGEFNLGWTSDCTPNRTSTGGRACCCEVKTPSTIIAPEICLKPLGSTVTATQKEACAKVNGQIVCSNQCNYTTSADANHLLGTSGLATQPEFPGTCPGVTSCYCACGQSGNNNGNVQTATEGPSWEGTIPAIDVKKLGANLSQAIETAKSILDKLIFQK